MAYTTNNVAPCVCEVGTKPVSCRQASMPMLLMERVTNSTRYHRMTTLGDRRRKEATGA